MQLEFFKFGILGVMSGLAASLVAIGAGSVIGALIFSYIISVRVESHELQIKHVYWK